MLPFGMTAFSCSEVMLPETLQWTCPTAHRSGRLLSVGVIMRGLNALWLDCYPSPHPFLVAALQPMSSVALSSSSVDESGRRCLSRPVDVELALAASLRP